jgi:hypothetical protein
MHEHKSEVRIRSVQCDRAGDTVGVIVRVRHHQGQSASAPHADNDLIESC